MAIAVDHIRYLDGASSGTPAGCDPADVRAGRAGASVERHVGHPIDARPSVVQRRRRAGLLALAVALVLAGITSTFVGSDSGGRLSAQADGSVSTVQPRSITIPVGAAGAGAASAVVVDAGQSVWDVVAPYTPGNVSVHEWVASVLQHNDLDASAVRAGTLIRLP